MAEPYRNRGGVMPEKEYGAERQRAGWVKMVHPDLPDNDPINVAEQSVPQKMSKGWVPVKDTSMPSELKRELKDANAGKAKKGKLRSDTKVELTEDED